MQFAVEVEILDGVIPASPLTCLMLDTENIRHLKSLRALERSDILHTFYIQKHAQNDSDVAVVQTGWNGCQNRCPFTVLMCWEKWCYGWNSSRHRGSVLDAHKMMNTKKIKSQRNNIQRYNVELLCHLHRFIMMSYAGLCPQPDIWRQCR